MVFIDKVLRKRKLDGLAPDGVLIPSGGEIHYLWYYIQGSIMNGDVRRSLYSSWGFCERHAWIAIQVEASFRHCFMMGPAILYEDLLHRAAPIVGAHGLWGTGFIRRRLREKGPCLMCHMNLGPDTKGMAREELIARGRDRSELHRLAEMSRSFWERTVCGRCSGTGDWPRCRPHLLDDMDCGRFKEMKRQRAMMEWMKRHIIRYSRSFEWAHRGTATDEDRASLISAVGWFSGWRPFLSIVGMRS